MTVDLSNPDKVPFKHMSDAEKGALLLAERNGEEIQQCDPRGYGQWRDCDIEPRAWENDVYRVKPETVSRMGVMNIEFEGVSYRFSWEVDDNGPRCETVTMNAIGVD